MGDTAKLIERLEQARTDFWSHTRMDCLREAADALTASESTVAALRAEVERLTKALEPFANYIAGAKGLADHVTISNGSRFARMQLTVGDCRTAARALDRSPSVESGNG